MIQLKLPDDLENFLKEQANKKGYPTSADYILDLIRQEQKREEEEQLKTLLLEGLDSGESIQTDDLWWEKRRNQLINHLSEEVKSDH